MTVEDDGEPPGEGAGRPYATFVERHCKEVSDMNTPFAPQTDFGESIAFRSAPSNSLKSIALIATQNSPWRPGKRCLGMEELLLSITADPLIAGPSGGIEG